MAISTGGIIPMPALTVSMNAPKSNCTLTPPARP
jgi:hypothetical protein